MCTCPLVLIGLINGSCSVLVYTLSHRNVQLYLTLYPIPFVVENSLVVQSIASLGYYPLTLQLSVCALDLICHVETDHWVSPQLLLYTMPTWSYNSTDKHSDCIDFFIETLHKQLTWANARMRTFSTDEYDLKSSFIIGVSYMQCQDSIFAWFRHDAKYFASIVGNWMSRLHVPRCTHSPTHPLF